ncbi:hypothetical protein GLOTRDRAFT_81604 [Gloeophyllum trabeum ATCC 11539]|uniref:histone acetyltransferase n=1 Tax=Gloeophyllum trabeum (strain ATCC 11539 / FP-39264 / Madison 617) TaxID=670483 RepID=S7PUH1_GLOTA|nr:uncharacterized protein GLOTRDRAFT_81604 [Gloeophyllum trabeum ATCC 11539]EPQ51008.1 hypothetical protein GLOTRDRAFT_81604 [Gloeophyllum trabeum ATCC 11539]
MSRSLRDALLKALETLPGTRQFHLHVLVSAPRKHAGLYPYAHPRPKVYLSDVLVLLSEQKTPDAPRVFVAGIEAYLYHVPATSCLVLNVAKLDSTGQAAAPSPTATLIRAFIAYYGDPATRPINAQHLWIHLFARAQNQYMFPNSSEHPGKHPLSDIKLCAWWKRILSDVAADLESRIGEKSKLRLYYVLPGYSELEAVQSLHSASASWSTRKQPSVAWIYGHPYSQTDIPLPCSNVQPKEGQENLGLFIPSFEDDPKSRFIDEIAYTVEGEGVRSPQRKRARTLTRTTSTRDIETTRDTSKERHNENEKDQDERPQGELGKVSPNEFWERMSFRQECISGAVTGFFVMAVSTPMPADTTDPLAPQPGQVSAQMIKRIMATLLTGHEFSNVERAVRATESLEASIKGLCDGVSPVPSAPIKPLSSGKPLSSAKPRSSAKPVSSARREKTPERDASSSSNDIYASLPRTPPRRPTQLPEDTRSASPSPFPEPETSLDTYHTYIYGSVQVDNPLPPPKVDAAGEGGQAADGGVEEPKVTVLTVRKKKKKADS